MLAIGFLLLAPRWGAYADAAYTVRPKDTLGTIAGDHGTSTAVLIRLNNLKNPDRLTVGQVLRLPGGAPPVSSAGRSVSTTYTVRPKDTLGVIAGRNGTTTAELIRLNNLAHPDRLSVGQVLRLPSREKTYTVRKGDVLSAIAAKYGLRTDALARYNQLRSADQIVVGMDLRIPLSSTDVPAKDLPDTLERELSRIRVSSRRWQYIVIHHTATDQGTIKGFDSYHRRRGMENGLAYHFVIGNGKGIPDGRIEIGDRWRKQLNGGHMASSALNHECIGICLVGNFEKGQPSRKQMESLHALSTYLTRRCRLDKSRLKVHRQINTKPTICPGKHFPLTRFLRDFQA